MKEYVIEFEDRRYRTVPDVEHLPGCDQCALRASDCERQIDLVRDAGGPGKCYFDDSRYHFVDITEESKDSLERMGDKLIAASMDWFDSPIPPVGPHTVMEMKGHWDATSSWLEFPPEGQQRFPDVGKPSNPKTAIGDKKVPLALLSPIASAHWAAAQHAGMCKYQAWNWRIAGVRISTYVSAMKRHIDAFVSGEQFDPIDGTRHLGNIMACAAILLDAEAAGKLTDDRPPSVGVRETFDEVMATMAANVEQYKHIPQTPFTIADTETTT